MKVKLLKSGRQFRFNGLLYTKLASDYLAKLHSKIYVMQEATGEHTYLPIDTEVERIGKNKALKTNKVRFLLDDHIYYDNCVGNPTLIVDGVQVYPAGVPANETVCKSVTVGSLSHGTPFQYRCKNGDRGARYIRLNSPLIKKSLRKGYVHVWCKGQILQLPSNGRIM